MKTTNTTTAAPPLHSIRPQRRRHFNRIFATIYTLALLSHFYHHIQALIHYTNIVSLFISLSLFISDIILAYMWSTTQAFRMNPITRQVYPENLGKYLAPKDFPAMDIFICTADPFKEPPINVVNTALSVMAYEYPPEKVSVYVSDDGGSELTMFGFMEAAKFGKVWLPFCRENNVVDRCPHAYFTSNSVASNTHQVVEIKKLYEDMKTKVENVVTRGTISDEYISTDQERQLLNQFRTKDFSRQNHPSVIQVLVNSHTDRDSTGQVMPNLIYVSREKSKATPHQFKAGALNALLRVSAVMTNAPVILTLDCDMYSNDPLTPHRVLCFFTDKAYRPNCGYIQFPQTYHGLNKADIYACEHKHLFILNPIGMDGLSGTSYVGTGCFFRRRVFFGGPSSYVEPGLPELSPNATVDNKHINSPESLKLANRVSGCNYENRTDWGSKIGFRYGSLVEDYYTGYRLQCEGWESIFCHPSRPAFLGDIPITLHDALSQTKRWAVGLFEVGFSKYSPVTFGIQAMGVLMGQSYAYYAFWLLWSIPMTVYSFIPSLAFLNAVPVFPKVHEPWFYLYMFLFLGAYMQDCIDFLLTETTFERWWSDQRMWLIRGLTSYSFAAIEFISKCIGVETHGFNVTSKVMDDEQSKRYDQGIFEFGVASPMFLPIATVAILNLVSLAFGILHISRERSLDYFLLQTLLAGFGVVNSLPIYEGMFLRGDQGRMPTTTTIISIALALASYVISSYALSL